jgi:hypothetical protein
MYFVKKNGRLGRCRRHAPTMSGFPVVYEDDWCGDHKLKEIPYEPTTTCSKKGSDYFIRTTEKYSSR